MIQDLQHIQVYSLSGEEYKASAIKKDSLSKPWECVESNRSVALHSTTSNISIMPVARAVTIAGSDSSGGAGIQADIKTFQECGTYGMSVITALTAQNTLGVHDVHCIPVSHIAAQFDALEEDVRPDAAKTGMLADQRIIETVCDKLSCYNWPNLVVDPVMIAKGGTPLMKAEAIEKLRSCLLPLATVVTPNIPETEALTSLTIKNRANQLEAAKRLHDMGVEHVLIKGGHGPDTENCADLLYNGREGWWIVGPRHASLRTHGTGCTLSSAITAYLAQGWSVLDAVVQAKQYIHLAIMHPIAIGNGHGPVNHWATRLIKNKEVGMGAST